MSQLRVYGLDLGQTNITSCVASHNLHRKKLMRTTRDIHRPWSLWGMLTICWKSNRAGHKQSTKFLECMDAWHRWLGSQLGKALCWTWHLNKEEPVGCICGCSNNESVIQHAKTREQGKIRITILNTERTDSGLFRDLLWRTLWGYTPPEKGVQENSFSRTTFKLNNSLLTHAGSQGRVTGGIHQCTKSPLKKGSIQEMEAASSHSGGIQGQSLSLQGWIYRWFWHEIWKTRRTSSRRKSRKNMSPVSNKVKIQVAKNFDHLHY